MAHPPVPRPTKSTIWPVLVFVTALAVFNIAFITSHGWSRLGWNALGYACLLIAFRGSQLSLQAIGLSRASVGRGLRYAAYVIATLLVAMLAIFIFDKTAFQDSRYHHDFWTALYAVVILLPLKTVLFEEVAFRGILPAMLLNVKNDRRLATILAAGAFGLWHVSSAAAIGNYRFSDSVTIPSSVVIIGVVLATAAFGYLLLELRWRSRSLVAPLAVHWFINGFGIILAALSWR